MSTFEDVQQLLTSGVSGSLSRIGKNQASRTMRRGAAAHDDGTNPFANVQSRTVSRRETTTKGAARSSYLQGVEDEGGKDGGGGESSVAGVMSIREDDGLRREMCSSPRLHPGIQLERLRDYESDRGTKLSRLVHDDGEFSKIALKDEGTTLPGTAPIEQAWAPRHFRSVPADDPLAAKAISARSAPEKKMSRTELRELERKAPGTYFSGRKPQRATIPGVGHYRPKYEMVEYRMTGGYIMSPRSAAPLTPRDRMDEQQQQQHDGGNNHPHQLPAFTSPTAHHQLGGEGQQPQPHDGKVSPVSGSGHGGGSPTQQQQKETRDPRSGGLVAARPPFGVGSGFRVDVEQPAAKKDGSGGGADSSGSGGGGGVTNKTANGGTGRFAQQFVSTGPDSASYWPRIDPGTARAPCYVDMGRDRQDISRNPPAIPSVDITYPAADGISMALKSRTPRAFIAPKKPSDPPAHSSAVVGHYAESALVANAVLVAAAGGGGGGNGLSAPGDRLDLDADRSRDLLQKHSATLVNFDRSAKKHHSATGPVNSGRTDTSNVELYGGGDGPSAKRAVKPVNMDRMTGRPPVLPAPDVRVTEVRDEMIHHRPRETKFAPLQPPSVATRMAKLRSEREGAPRLCGTADVSPIRARVGTVGAVDFSKGTARPAPASGSLDLVYENLDPSVVSGHKRVAGDPMISTRVSRAKREQLAKPKWGALDKMYDTERGMQATLAKGGSSTLYEFDRRVDRRHAFTGGMPSEEYLRRTGAGGPGPGDFAGEIVPPMRGSPGRSFGKAIK